MEKVREKFYSKIEIKKIIVYYRVINERNTIRKLNVKKHYMQQIHFDRFLSLIYQN